MRRIMGGSIPFLLAPLVLVTCAPRTCPMNAAPQAAHPGADGARCDHDDPSCRPIPFANACYDPAATRTALQPRTDDSRAKRFDLGPCDHDGECAASCCGCTRYRPASDDAGRVSFRDACLCVLPADDDKRLKDAFCGCVEGQCR